MCKPRVVLWIAALAFAFASGLVFQGLAGQDPAPKGPGAPAGAQPARTDAPTWTSVRRLPDAVTLATLSNGLTVIVQENHVAPVATVRCFVKNTGSAFEGRHLGAGISHVLEHVVSGGTTTKRSEKEIEAVIDRFGGATNAFTSSDMTAYFIDCPAKDVFTAIELVADSMQHVAFEPAEFERELAVVRRELADGEVDRRRVQWNMLGQTVYLEHPVRHPTIGYLDVLNQTTNEAIIDFYRRRYVPNNQVFVVVGDVEAGKVLEAVAGHWAGTPRGPETYAAFEPEPQQLSPREAVREMDGTTYDLMFAWPTVELSHPDLFALDLAAYVLGEGESSRLARGLKYGRGLVLSVRTASYTPHYVRGWFGVLASAQPDHWKEASDEVLREVYRLRDELVAPAELAKAKKQKAAELVMGQQTVQDAADSLGRNFLSTGDPLFEKQYVEAIQKVTAEDIREAARRYFKPERLNRVVIAPPGGAPKTAEAGARAAESEVRLVKLSNGLRVLLKRHAHKPMVNIQAYALCGALVETEETAGLASLVAAMLDKGTARLSAAQIAEYFDSIGGQFSATAGRNTVFASATVLREDFAQAAAVFAECLTGPAFPDQEFAQVKKLALGAVARRADNPQQEVFEVFYDALPKESAYHVIQGGKKESVERLKPEDLRAYHARYFVPGNMIVTVFGDADPDEALAVVQKHFGAMPEKPAPPAEFNRPNALPEDIVRHKQTAKETGMVLLGYPGPGIFDKKEHAALTVLDAVMSGYSYPGGWLHGELRGAGLVYFVHAFQMTGPAPGYFVVLCQTRPDAIGEAVDRIRKNVARAREGKVPEEEFRRAVDMVVALHAQENTTIAEQAQQAALDELYGLGHDYSKTFEARIRAVTLADVTAAARRVFGRSVLVTSSPSPAGAGKND